MQTRSGFEKTKQEKQELGQTDKKEGQRTQRTRDKDKSKKKKKRREDSGKHSHIG